MGLRVRHGGNGSQRRGRADRDEDDGDDEDTPPQRLGDARPGVSDHEAAHGLNLPVNTYPLFENALRARDHRSLAEHQRRLGRLFSPFTRVAAANPYAWFPRERSPEELVEVGPDNRMVSSKS